MSKKSKSLVIVRLVFLCLFFPLLLACGSNDSYVGIYKASANDSPRQDETTLELKQNGDGVWRVGDDEIPFSWEVKHDELRVNTKGGGVIVGRIEKEMLSLTLPGSKLVSFKKIH
ncbi:hypothetical protein [Syntrophobacter fumaroxidans]|uniref:Lipoprotein n=1 Tax=Syntrophobacter fumaroxidans (strain DSM 10017 / MPOB) TaxID=335543 RepID=A0LIF1_SYNFM|nr:hypothetical protein [Syntrophobacter fumaroxidans]ABK17203.1 hypothetical protein Sfum_1515 [Syntrophobacter fumaroxidans MPOB]